MDSVFKGLIKKSIMNKTLLIYTFLFLLSNTAFAQNYALDFDGVNDYVSTPIDADLQAMPYTTWSGWIKPTGVSGWQMIFDMEDGGWDRFLAIESGGLGLSMGNTSGHWQTGASVTAGVWQHVVAVYDNGAMRFYHNGTEYTTGLTEGGHSSAGTFTIGANQNGSVNSYIGIIDEVAVWNEALTATEIATLYNSGSGLDAASNSGAYTSSGNLVGYYKMDDGIGNTTIDASGNTNTATLNNMDSSTDWVTGYAIQDNTAPTGSLAYSVGGTTVSAVSVNDVVTITTTFNESIADSPVMQISGSGVETISATNMTKVSANSYTYAWTVGTGAGTQTFTLATGTDTAGNVVIATPTSGSTIVIDAPQHLTKHGKISIASVDLVNKYGALGGSSGLTVNGKRISTSTAPDGLTSVTASTSAYQIKQDFPGSTDGLYWIANSNINSGTPFQIYADMTTDGGGWTLIMTNTASSGWTYTNAIERNTSTPSITTSYSIIAWADDIKRSASGFQYMIDAGTRGTHGAIWTANSSYSFVNSDNTQTNVTINTKFGTWNYHDRSIEQRMPWYSNCNGLITTSVSCNGEWWGTLIATPGWTPAPYMASDCGDSCLQGPGIIWYWVR